MNLKYEIKLKNKIITGISCKVRHINNGSTLVFDTKFPLDFFVYLIFYSRIVTFFALLTVLFEINRLIP